MEDLEYTKFFYEKSEKCPLCKHEFKFKNLRAAKSRFVKTELSLRNIYEPIFLDYYDVITCPKCGYAAIRKFFDKITDKQINNILNNTDKEYKPIVFEGFHDFNMALKGLKAALYFSIIKGSSFCERAYIAYKIANISEKEDEKVNETFSKYAYNWLLKAYSDESENEINKYFGMNKLKYLIAYFAYVLGDLQKAKIVMSELAIVKGLPKDFRDKIEDFIQILK